MDIEQIAKHLMSEAKSCSSVGYAQNCNDKLMTIAAMVSYHKIQDRRVELLRLLEQAELNSAYDTLDEIKKQLKALDEISES